MDTSDKSKNTKAPDATTTASDWPTIESQAWLEESVDSHLNCVLCGTQLIFSHQTDFIKQVVSENAHCPACKVRTRQSEHSLQ